MFQYFYDLKFQSMFKNFLIPVIEYLLDWSCPHKKALLIDAPLITIDFTTAYVLLFIPPEVLTEGQQLAAIFAGIGGGAFSFVRMFFFLKEKLSPNPNKGMGGSEGFF